MEKCSYCRKGIREIPFKCKLCKKYYCSKHLVPENHKCQGLPKFSENKDKWQKAINERHSRDGEFDSYLNTERISLNQFSKRKSKRKTQTLIWAFAWVAVTILLIWYAMTTGWIIIFTPLPIYLAFKALEEFFSDRY
ncbi:hypothetical protein HY212_05240 [Candidatus Pacearchaeota archaeon]|nr:hypothetical protein [Candidatus Pacearchaeota archaeon]